MPSLVGIVSKTNEMLHIVQSVALAVCFSIRLITTHVRCYKTKMSTVSFLPVVY